MAEYSEPPELFSGTVVEAWADDTEDIEDDPHRVSYQAYLQSTDWTLGTILNQIEQTNIDMNPQFQRRTVWSTQRMSRYIESLIVGIPVPQLVFAEDKKRRGGFIVLDGKQRLTAIQRFAGANNTDAGLRLKGLTLRSDLEGMTFNELAESSEHYDDFRALMNATIRTVAVYDWKDSDYLSIVFHRLNTGSVALASQELRQALYPGPFSSRLDSYAAESESLHLALRTDRADFRMRDTELALRFLAFSLRLEEYSGNLKRFMDETTEMLNARWERWEAPVEHALDQLDAAVMTSLTVFGPNAFRRYSKGKYESLFNRAIFDVQVLYFSHERYRDAGTKRASRVKEAFEQVLMSDPEFAISVSSTTKSLDATAYRLRRWGEALQEATGVQGALPALDENRRIVWNE